MIRPSNKLQKGLLFALKLFVLVFALGFIIYRIRGNPHFNEEIKLLFQEQFQFPNTLFMAGVIVIMPLNWFLEAKKWQMLVKPIEPLSLFGALRGVLTGLSIGFVSEAHIGSFLGRIGQIGSEHRFRAIGATLLNSSCQNFGTYFLGAMSLLYFLSYETNTSGQWPIVGGAFTILIFSGVLLFLLNLPSFVHWFERFFRVYQYLMVIASYQRSLVALVLGISLLRILLYSFQFYLLLLFYGSELTILDTFVCINLMYLAKGVLPSFSFLSELGIREFTALYFFGAFSVGDSLVMASTLTLWLINVLIPALLGLYFAWNLKALQAKKAANS